METPPPVPVEKPRNGVAGLKYWRHDIVAGLLVALISLPFSLGIAVASGAPPIAGLVSAIIAGLILPFLGGSYVTISGPAAGLAPVLLVAMTALGRGDLAAGYPLLLGVIFMAGCVQVVLSRLKAARYCALFPTAVVEGMLAAIGLLIIAKQLPSLCGHPFRAHEFFGVLAEAPAQLARMVPRVFLLGVACLALIFVLSAVKVHWLKVMPPQVVAVGFGVLLARLLHLDAQYLIHVPENVLAHGIVLPNFRGLFADHSLWLTVATTVITLTLIDGVESLATVTAVDKIDPYRRRSDPDRTLLAMGISNICSSVVGGLTIIPGGVKSKACIEGGGRTLWANFYNAMFLLIFLFLARDLINFIPLGALAAVLVHTGYKLCRPTVWRHIAHIGSEQLVVFSVTVMATLCTDLLWGIVAGIVAKLLIEVAITGKVAAGGADRLAPLLDLFRNPVTARELAVDGYHLYFGRPLVCFNALAVGNELKNIPHDSSTVVLHITARVALIDHTSCENLIHFVEEFERSGRGHIAIEGIDAMRKRSAEATCMRLAARPAADDRERRSAFALLTRLSLGSAGPDALHPEGELARLSLSSAAIEAPSFGAHPITAGIAQAGVLLRDGLGVLRSLAASALRDVEEETASDHGGLDWMSLSRTDHDRLDAQRELDHWSLTCRAAPKPSPTGAPWPFDPRR